LAAGLDFLLLGPVEARFQGRAVPLGGIRQRSVLAQLLLNPGSVVSTDRLVDELWGDSPPATATTALQGYISQLRKALDPVRGDGVGELIVTREPGYLIAIDPEQLDVSRFERLRSSARESMAEGDPDAALTKLDEALALWRGGALEDLAAERFAADAARRLDETRAAAIEERFDAGLAVGMARELVPEIEAQVAREPLREHLREQQSLALYRSGRQADALRAYDDARRALVGELGIEPGSALRRLHQQILEQDPWLDVESVEPAEGKSAGRKSRRRAVWVAGSLGLAAVVVVALVLALSGGHSAGAIRADSMVAISPATGRVERSYPVGGDPTDVAVGSGAAWAVNADDQTVTRIDLRTHALRTFGTGGVPLDLAVGDGSLWVGHGSRPKAQFVGPVVTSVSRLDPDSAAILATIALPAARGQVSNQSKYHIAVDDRAVWAINPDFSVSRIDPASNRIAARIRDVNAVALASSPTATWALERSGTIARLSPDSDRAVQRIRVPASGLTSIAVGGGAIWATDPYEGSLWRINLGSTPVERTIPLAVGGSDVAYGAGQVWVTNGPSGTLSRIDPRSNRVTKVISIGNTPGRLAVGNGAVWAAVAGAPGASLPAVGQGDAGIRALPSSVCGRVFFGNGGSPQRLIVSDLPLRGAPGLPTQQMSSAIAYVLREHGFRAGRFRVGYQSCDDSTSQTGIFDDRKCTANAKAWVRNPLVIGVIGPYNSSCAADEIPVANRGGLAMISPTNSDAGLTHAGPLTPPGLPERLYPTGIRNYARLYPSDDRQGAAMAEFASQRGLSPVYVLDDREYGAAMAFSFRRAARRLGLRLAGASSWDPAARGYGALADRVARSGARAVYVSGLIDAHGGAVVGALRERLGPRATILANDGFLPIAELFGAAGDAAHGVFVSTAALPNAELGLAGREFVSRFAATQHGASVDHAAVYAAEATEVMLDSIARSDGSRGSTTHALLTAGVPDGILRGFRFDPNGDPTAAPITIVEARAAGGDTGIESVDGADVRAVIEPSPSLLR
jgi:YVTN family beta-propeller protein